MSQADDDRFIDAAAGVDLGYGYSLAWSVGPDGDTWPLVYDQRQLEPQAVPYQPSHFRDLAPHEMTGRLPSDFQQFRCGARKQSGKPCQSVVSGPSARCRHHGDATPPPPLSSTSPPRADVQAVLFDVDEHGEAR